MATLSLKANPTFKAKVGIPVAGGAAVDVEFEFRHKTKKELAEFLDGATEMTDKSSIMATVCGWELSDPFNEDSVDQLIQNYHGAARAIVNAYLIELSQVKIKN